jgi:hypothetical protein
MSGEDIASTSSFWHIIRIKFDNNNGFIISLLSLLVSVIIGIFINYSTNKIIAIASSIVIFIGLIFIALIWTFYRTADDLFHENISLKDYKFNSPSVIQVRQNENSIICLLKPSNLFSTNAIVTLYDYHNRYERPIGFGEVMNIQDDGIIQIELIKAIRGQEKFLEKLTQNNAECLTRLRVKPLVLKKYLKDI